MDILVSPLKPYVGKRDYVARIFTRKTSFTAVLAIDVFGFLHILGE
jgi:hypothetical protein